MQRNTTGKKKQL